MSRIDKMLIESINGLKHHQVIDLQTTIKTIMVDYLNKASKEIYDSGVDREVLIKVYNKMLLKIKKD